jgi:hypothetical protein
MAWNIEKSKYLTPSIEEFAKRYNVSEQMVFEDVRKFMEFKKQNGPGVPFPSSADKASGYHPNGSIAYRPFIENAFHHCHMDYRNGDPMIVYRVISQERKIRIVCICDHTTMFRNRSDFRQQHTDEFPKTKPRK